MLKYTITQYSENKVVLEVDTEDAEHKRVQLTLQEFNTFMSYPAATKTEICDILWNICDKSQGRLALEHTVDLVFEILGRDLNDKSNTQ